MASRPSRESPAPRPARPIIRAAGPRDLDAVMAVETSAFPDPWSRRAFEALMGDRRVHFTVALRGGATVGHAVAWYVLDEGEIANLAVAAHCQGQGVGSALLDDVIAESVARGVASLYLEVRVSNAPALALYASRGFEEVARRPRYYRRPVEDALLLRLSLGAGPVDGMRSK